MKPRHDRMIRVVKRGRIVVFMALASMWACSDGKGAATTPSGLAGLHPTPLLTGIVSDRDTSASVAGATVYIVDRSGSAKSTTTDVSGNYSFTTVHQSGLAVNASGYTYVSAENYVGDYRYIRGTTHNVRMPRIERIMAGESKLVTVAPDDSLCINNVQDSPGLGPDYVCRSVFVVAPNDGAVTIEAVSTQDGSHPFLEVETVGGSARMGNPTTIQVKAGTVIVATVEMLSNSTASQSFVVTTTSRSK